jgi:hypothetical protein
MTTFVRQTALAALAALAGPAQAASPWDQMFPQPSSCYQRTYSADHLAAHPAQRVTGMTLAAAPEVPADPWPAVALVVSLRGPGGGTAQALAYCENEGGATLYCMMEGDAGAFTIEPANGGAVLVTVGRDGMSLETDTDFITLEARRGDDRSFILRPADGCR